MNGTTLRIDRLLWFLRFARSRSAAQKWVGEGHIRRNGQRVTRLDQPIALGDVLVLPLARKVLVIEISSLPTRRGPAEEARSHYQELDAGPTIAIASEESLFSEGYPHP